MRSPHMSDITGKILGRYKIIEQIGEGGMAIVYKAYDSRLDTDVAVKVIRVENIPPYILKKALIRFEREAKALAKLTHPNIVKVLDYGEFEGEPFLVMPYLPGGTLKQLLTGKSLPWQQSVNLLIPISRALSYAHKQGMIHRDVKPSNILITQSGEPMVTDYGIAKILDEEITQDLTGTSTAIGTPEYMSPEQVTSKTVDHRTDIYSLGVVLYEMVTGRKPFKADTPVGVLFKHASEPLPSPKKFAPNLPDAVEKVILKAMAKQRDERYQSMDDFTNDLISLTQNRAPNPIPSRSNNSLLWLGGLGILALLAVSVITVAFLAIKNFLPTPATAIPTSAPQIVYVRITDTPAPTSVPPADTAVPPPTSTRKPASTPTVVSGATVKVSLMSLRDGPDLRFPKIGDFPKGTPVKILYKYHGWVFVEFSNGKTGWVVLEWLDLPPGFSIDDVPEATGSQIPAACKKYCK